MKPIQPSSRPLTRISVLMACIAVAACGGGGDAGTGGGAAPPTPSPPPPPAAGAKTLTIQVEGGSSVQFFDNQGTRRICTSTPEVPGGANGCSVTLPDGFPVDIQRTLSLPVDEEASWRISSWRGACLGIVDPNTETRGGHCRITMDADKQVVVGFERRWRVNINHAGPDPMSVRWELDYTPREQRGGNNFAGRGVFDCPLPAATAAGCRTTSYYDNGTTVIVKAGIGTPGVANFQNWSGACAGAGGSETCTVLLGADADITGHWAQD